MSSAPRILYCHCQYAQVVSKWTKEPVLKALCESGLEFDAVADLCEMSARKDPALQRLAAEGTVKIAACFPRAIKGLFGAAGAPLTPEHTEVVNMRSLPPEQVIAALTAPLQPNLPTGKYTAPAPTPAEEAAAETSSGTPAVA